MRPCAELNEEPWVRRLGGGEAASGGWHGACVCAGSGDHPIDATPDMPHLCSHTLLALSSVILIGLSPPLKAQQADPPFGPTVRWQDDDGAALWIGTDVAIGDDGATVISAKESSRPMISVYSSLVGEALFDHPLPYAFQIRVDAAERSTEMAAMVLHHRRPGWTKNMAPELWFWSDANDPEPTWKFAFPEADSWFYRGMDVHVSADGQTIVAWNTYTRERRNLIHVFDADGTIRGTFETTQEFNSSAGEQAVVSQDMRRLLMDVGGHPQLIDLETGELLKEWKHHDLRSGHTLSGDGRTVAISDEEQVRIHREDADGKFPRIGTYTLPSHQTASQLALDGDGSHLAILATTSSPADQLDLVVYDVNATVTVDLHRFSAPDNYYSVAATGLHMTEDAAMIVGSTYGDGEGLIPDAFAFQPGRGVTAEIFTDGSAFACDMDPTGQFFVVATKDKHANSIGTGGDIVYADTRLVPLTVTGLPRLGHTLTARIAGAHEQAWVVAASALGQSATPWGVSQLDLATAKVQGLVPLHAGVAERHLSLPTAPAAHGMAIHVQAGFVDDGLPVGNLTNRVSFRIQG